MYVYSLQPPERPDASAPPRGEALFADACGGCHTGSSYGGRVIPADDVGTDPALATGRGRGTGKYRVAPLVRIADGAPYLHDGSVASLEELLSPERLSPDYEGGRFGPGPIPGHTAGTDLAQGDRAALIAFLETI